MKFSSKLALVAAASLLSVTTFAQTVPAELTLDTLKASITTDMALSELSADGGAYINQNSTAGGMAFIDQDNTAGGNWAYINQTNATAPAEAHIIQSSDSVGSIAVIFQK